VQLNKGSVYDVFSFILTFAGNKYLIKVVFVVIGILIWFNAIQTGREDLIYFMHKWSGYDPKKEASPGPEN
jgi:hypothetical protein